MELNPPTTITDHGLVLEKNPVEKSNSTGPIKCNGNVSLSNKHAKTYQPLISAFLRPKSTLVNETSMSEQFLLDTENRFPSLIDEQSQYLNALDNV